MPTLQIRNVPQKLYDELKRKAIKSRRSLNQEAIVMLELAMEEHNDNHKKIKMATIDRILSRGPVENIDASMGIDQIRKDRDSDCLGC